MSKLSMDLNPESKLTIGLDVRTAEVEHTSRIVNLFYQLKNFIKKNPGFLMKDFIRKSWVSYQERHKEIMNFL